MRAGLAVPAAGAIASAAQFDGIWNTPDGSVPPTSTWAGWAAWGAVAGSGEFLAVERVNLLPLFLGPLDTHTVTVNHLGGGGAASYVVVRADGTRLPAVNVTPRSSASIPGLRAGDTVELYLQAGGRSLGYTYVVSSTGATFDFDGASWIPR
jgi:hypothetical protein